MPKTRGRCGASTSSMTSRLQDTATTRLMALRAAATTKAPSDCASAQTNMGADQEIRSPIRVVRLRPSRLVMGAAKA